VKTGAMVQPAARCLRGRTSSPMQRAGCSVVVGELQREPGVGVPDWAKVGLAAGVTLRVL